MFFAPVVLIFVFSFGAMWSNKQHRRNLTRLLASLTTLMVEISLVEVILYLAKFKSPEVMLTAYFVSFIAIVFHGSTFFIDFDPIVANRWSNQFSMQIKGNLATVAILAIVAVA